MFDCCVTKQWEKKVEEGQKNFDRVSKVLKREVKRFEVSAPIIKHISNYHAILLF